MIKRYDVSCSTLYLPALRTDADGIIEVDILTKHKAIPDVNNEILELNKAPRCLEKTALVEKEGYNGNGRSGNRVFTNFTPLESTTSRVKKAESEDVYVTETERTIFGPQTGE
jgi:hypothetical protein